MKNIILILKAIKRINELKNEEKVLLILETIIYKIKIILI